MKTRVRQLKDGHWIAEVRKFPFFWLTVDHDGDERVGSGLIRTKYCGCKTLHEARLIEERYTVNRRNNPHNGSNPKT